MARTRNIKPSPKFSEGLKISLSNDLFFCSLKGRNNSVYVRYINYNMYVFQFAILLIKKAIFFCNGNAAIFFRGININCILLSNKAHLSKSLKFLKEFTRLQCPLQAPYKELKSHA